MDASDSDSNSAPILGFIKSGEEYREVTEDELARFQERRRTRSHGPHPEAQGSSFEFSEEDCPLNQPLYGLPSYIDSLEQDIDEEEGAVQRVSGDQVVTERRRPLLSSTDAGLLDNTVFSNNLSVSNIVFERHRKVIVRPSSSSDESFDTGDEGDATIVKPVSQILGPAILNLPEEQEFRVGLSGEHSSSRLNLQLIPVSAEEETRQPPSGRISRARTPEERAYQENLIAEGLGHLLPESPDRNESRGELGQDLTSGELVVRSEENSGDSPNTPEPTLDDMAEMAAARAEAVTMVGRIAVLYDDDYEGLELDQMPLSEVKRLNTNALEAKQKLTDAYFTLNGVDAAVVAAIGGLEGVEALKRKFIEYYRRGMARQAIMEAASRPPTNERQSGAGSAMSAATENIMSARVRDRETIVITVAEGIIDELVELIDEFPSTNRKLIELEGKLVVVKEKSVAASGKLRELIASATKVGLGEAATRMSKALDDLEGTQGLAVTSVCKARVQLGIPSGGLVNPAAVALKAPMFKGEYSDSMDFYTFKTKLEEYLDSVSLNSKSERLLKLKNECVSGQAKEAISAAKTYEEAMKMLKRYYGKPKILYAQKEAEIIALGQCPAGMLQRRSWLINVSNKMKTLRELSVTHGITELFDESTLSSTVSRLFVKEDKTAFDKKTINSMNSDSDDDISRKDITDAMMIFLEKTIRKVGKEINYRITAEHGTAGEMLKSLTIEEGKTEASKLKTTPSRPPYKKPGAYVAGESRPKGGTAAESGSCSGSVCGSGTTGENSGVRWARVDDNGVVIEEKEPVAAVEAASEAAISGNYQNNENIVINTNKSKEPKYVKCGLCQQDHTTLIYCETFRKMWSKQRWPAICQIKACYRCLRLDANYEFRARREWYEAHAPFCDDTHLCKIGECAQLEPHRRNHIMVCGRHVGINKDHHEDLIRSVDPTKLTGDYKKFFFTAPRIFKAKGVEGTADIRIDELACPPEDDSDAPIYMLQVVAAPDGTLLLVFWDTGCWTAAISDRAAIALESQVVTKGPTMLEVAGGAMVRIPYGDESFQLPLNNGGTSSKLVGLRMREITTEFPAWDLMEAMEDVKSKFAATGGNPRDLPEVPPRIGGSSVDVMMGIRYYRYFPEVVFELPSGLKIHKSKFAGAGGFTGVLGGPHPAWKRAMAAAHVMGPRAYFTSEMRTLQSHEICLKHPMKLTSPCAEPEVEIVPTAEVECCDECGQIFSHSDCSENDVVAKCFQAVSTELKVTRGYQASSVELKNSYRLSDIGGDVEYRCVGCRACHDCSKGELLEQVSLQDEKEQHMIEGATWLDEDEGRVYARLPFIVDPAEKLKPNRRCAERVLESQIKAINKNPESRLDILKSHNKLLDNGHVIPISMLPVDVQIELLRDGYWIPWRVVWNVGSLSTPVRMVFDGSARTPGGLSLNETLAKGENKLARLLHLLVLFRSGNEAFSTDISMAYNQVRLVASDYKFQKYLFPPDLDDAQKAVAMVVITMIYGIRCSGNITMAGFQCIVDYARQFGGKLEIGADCLSSRAYMDDVLAAYETVAARDEAAEGLVEALKLGGMTVKAVAYSGKEPPEKMSADGVTVGALGYVWNTAEDTMKLDIKPVTLGKGKRGKPAEAVEGDIREALSQQFTRRIIAGQTAKVYDPVGLASPILARLRVDMSFVCKLGGGWDDKLPADLLDGWVDHLGQVQQLDKLVVPRNTIPGEGANVELIVASDASQETAAAAVYSRVKLEDGTYVNHLMLARTRLALKMTIPKGELRGAVVAASIGRIVRHNLKGRVTRVWYVTDSTVALCWINTDTRPLQTGVRNAVIEIRRLSDPSEWFHVPGHLNPADVATRPVRVEEICGKSVWLTGYPWMAGPEEDMPLKTVDELLLTVDEEEIAELGIRKADVKGMILSNMVGKVRERYKGSRYLIDPCSRTWPRYLRLLSIVIKCAKIWRGRKEPFKREGDGGIILHQEDLAEAEKYTFLRTTSEVVRHNKPKAYERDSVVRDDILVFTGRILDDTKPEKIPGTMIDVGALNFCKPVCDRYSPVSYAVMQHCHMWLTHHGGAVSTYRRSLEIIHVLGGLDLAREIRRECLWCKRYKAKLLTESLSKIHRYRLTPSPSFYFTQCDLVGPFLARCEHKPHKAAVKVWGCIFKCQTTLAVWIECLPGCDAATFIDGYQRFSSRFGHPSVIHIDEQSSLKKAMNEMEISYVDVAKGINGKYNVPIEFKTCTVGQHQGQGIVERSARIIRAFFEAIFGGLRLTIMGYLTAFYFIANEMNNLPLCIGNKYKSVDEMDLMTPNRLLLGRNNQRAPTGLVETSTWSEKREYLDEVNKAWWEVWQSQWLVNLIPNVGGVSDTEQAKVDDIVIFIKTGKEANVGKTPWRTGRIVEVEKSPDGKARRVEIEYRHGDEPKNRHTSRSVRTIAILHREEDLDLFSKLNEECKAADIHLLRTYSEEEWRQRQEIGGKTVYVYPMCPSCK